MTDERYVYTQDIRDKKSTARSASKTNRKGKGPVKLPSDYLTKKEFKKMNGEVQNYNMSKRVNWSVFKFWPKDIQQEYLNKINDKLKATMKDLSEMFRCSVPTINRYFDDHGLVYQSDRGRRSCKEDPEWKKFCELDIPVTKVITPTPFTPVIEKCCTDEKLVAVKQENPIVCPYLESGTFTVTGDAYTVMDILEVICGKSKYKFTITFEEVNNEE